VCGDKSFITECGNDVVHQTGYGNGVRYWLEIKERISWNIQYYSTAHMLIYLGLITHTS
jgi:hypothetical protein